jgi:hypothetical protein
MIAHQHGWKKSKTKKGAATNKALALLKRLEKPAKEQP